MKDKWNYTYTLTNSVGGSETAAISLARSFPKTYEIYIGGDVLEEKLDNITFVNSDNLHKLLENNAFHTIIVSRYVNFLISINVYTHIKYIYGLMTYI